MSRRGGINKFEWNALGRVFKREIEGALILQSKARIYDKLAEDGMVERVTVEFPPDRFGPISVTGWALTHRGRIYYCQACEWFAPEDSP